MGHDPLAFASAAIMFRQEALAAWVIIYIFMISADSKNYGIDRTFINTVKMLTESKAAQFLGARSYSTYLLHVPVIIILAGWLTGSFHLQGIGLFAALLIALPTTFALQEPIYRWIERPGQLLARRWAKKLSISRTIERYVD
jgi:peptidoglycan/LPS O-acetylase OafA/YrhL